jgi:hypothetical protein
LLLLSDAATDTAVCLLLWALFFLSTVFGATGIVSKDEVVAWTRAAVVEEEDEDEEVEVDGRPLNASRDARTALPAPLRNTDPFRPARWVALLAFREAIS